MVTKDRICLTPKKPVECVRLYSTSETDRGLACFRISMNSTCLMPFPAPRKPKTISQCGLGPQPIHGLFCRSKPITMDSSEALLYPPLLVAVCTTHSPVFGLPAGILGMPKWCLRLCGGGTYRDSSPAGFERRVHRTRSLQTTHDNPQRDDNRRHDESRLPTTRGKERPREEREREICFFSPNVVQQLILTAAVKFSTLQHWAP